MASRSELLVALARGRFEDVIDSAETVELEFKSQPYLPWDNDVKRLEFAKDASGMANAGGGLIVLGYKTQPDLLTARDIVKTCTPVPTKLVDIDSYQKVLESWTYPPMRSIPMKWWGVNQGSGILTVDVPAATDSQQPILVLRASIEGMKRSVLFGHFLRTEAQVGESLVGELHADMQLGRMLRRAGVASLGIRALIESVSSTPSGPTDEQRRLRLEADTTDGQFRG